MAISAGGMWAADDRRDLIRASDYPTSGAWMVGHRRGRDSRQRPTHLQQCPRQAMDRTARDIHRSISSLARCLRLELAARESGGDSSMGR
jgi:hypothetical protein